MNYKTISLLSFVIIFINSCDKNSESFTLQGQYNSNTNASVSPVIMLTQQGQITDITTIKNYLSKQGSVIDYFIFDSTSVPIASNFLSLSINSNNAVTELLDTSTIPIQAEIVNQTSTQIEIAEDDSFDILMFSPNLNVTHCDTLLNSITIVKPAGKYSYLPPGSGYDLLFKFRPLFPIEIKNNNLFLPMISYCGSSVKPTQACSEAVRDTWNIFNASVSDILQPGDTIVYQTKEVQLIKK